MSKCRNCSCLCNHKNDLVQSQSDGYLIKLYFEIQKDKGENYFQALKPKLSDLSGIEEVKFTKDTLEVLYDDMLISPDDIKEILEVETSTTPSS